MQCKANAKIDVTDNSVQVQLVLTIQYSVSYILLVMSPFLQNKSKNRGHLSRTCIQDFWLNLAGSYR